MNNKTVAQVLGAVGVAVLITSPILLVFGAASTGFVLFQAVTGLILLGFWVGLDMEQVSRVFSGRGSFFMTTAAGLGLVLAIALGIANYAVATKFPKTWDLSQNKIFTLTEDTQKTLAGLKSPIHAYAFLTPTDRQYGVAKDLLDRYHDLAKSNFEYEFVDADKSPQLVSSFGIKKDNGPVLAIETTTKQQEKVGELNEEGLTNALVKITHQAQKKIYFTTGHGEADIKDKQGQDGYALMVDKLANEGINAETFSLVETKDVPSDAAAVLIVGPHKRFLEQEAQSLKTYLEKGGRVLLMLDPQIDVGLDKLLGMYGIELDNDVVIDPLARLQGTSPDVPIIQQYASSDITKGFSEYTVFPSTRSLVAANETGVDRPLALATTNPTAFGETDFAQLAQGTASPEGKKRGSLAVAILAKKAVTGNDKRSEEARLVVFGSSQWADNRWSQIGGNEDFFMNTVSYLAEATDRITIRARSRDASHLTMTPQQTTLVQFFSIDVLPVTLIAIGIAVWRVRRSK